MSENWELFAAKKDKFWSKVAKVQDADSCWLWLGVKDKKGGYGRLSLSKYHYVLVHRAAWFLEYGIPPADLCVCHKCDTPACVRPSHLFLGTVLENNVDRDLKGRTARGDRSGARLHPEKRARGKKSGAHTHPERRPWGDRNGSRLHPESRPRGDQHFSRREPEKWKATRARGERHGSKTHPERVPFGESNPASKLTVSAVTSMRKLRQEGGTYDHIANTFGVSVSVAIRAITGRTWKHVANPCPDRNFNETRARGDKNGSRLHPETRPKGETHARSKLTERDVIEIKARRIAGESYTSIAKFFNVNLSTISRACSGKNWKHMK